MSSLCQAKVYDLDDNQIIDIYLYGGVVWFHDGNDFELSHYHVVKFVETPEMLEEMIYELCDKIVIAVNLSEYDFKSFICNSGYKVYPIVTDDIECVDDEIYDIEEL